MNNFQECNNNGTNFSSILSTQPINYSGTPIKGKGQWVLKRGWPLKRVCWK